MVKTLLIIGFVWPEPKSSAAGSRMLQLIRVFLSDGYEITFASTSKTSPNTFDLKSIGVTTEAIELNDPSFDDFITRLQPNVVLFDRFMTEEQFGWRVLKCCPDAIRILDTEDFHGLRKARGEALKQNIPLNTTLLQNDITKREIASIYRCDLSLIISEFEMMMLTQDFNIDESLLHYVPFLLELVNTETPDFENRSHFITIGNFLHAPNADAVKYLKTTIWPLIRKQLPEAELHIYGAYPSLGHKELIDIANGFIVEGFVDDVNVVMKNARVCLAPLRFGAGLKGKLIDAMVNGVPCAMTEIAAEGMFGDLEPNGFVENSVESYVEKSVELYTNKALWRKKQRHGFTVLDHRFCDTDQKTRLIHRVNKIKSTIVEHRQNNFTGQLLNHHMLQSTKYMSKWIEAKNKSL